MQSTGESTERNSSKVSVEMYENNFCTQYSNLFCTIKGTKASIAQPERPLNGVINEDIRKNSFWRERVIATFS